MKINNHTDFKLQFPGQPLVIRDLLGGDALGMIGLSCRCSTAGGVKGPEECPEAALGLSRPVSRTL